MTEIFISYSSKDEIARETGDSIHRKLVDEGKGYKPYFDKRSANKNKNIHNEIREKIEVHKLIRLHI